MNLFNLIWKVKEENRGFSYIEQKIKGKGTVIPDVKSARELELQHAGPGISEQGGN